MELHHPTADSGLILIETPGIKSFTRPKGVGRVATTDVGATDAQVLKELGEAVLNLNR